MPGGRASGGDGAGSGGFAGSAKGLGGALPRDATAGSDAGTIGPLSGLRHTTR